MVTLQMQQRLQSIMTTHSITKDQILAALPALSKADNAAIAAMAADLAGKADKPPEGPETWLYEAAQALLGQPLNKGYRRKNKIALEFIGRTFAPALTNRTTGLAVMRYLLMLLEDDLETIKVPVTGSTMASHMDRLEQVFHKNFPGYGNDKAAKLILASILR